MTGTAIEPPFDHGVASFDPTSDSVVLWTRAPGVARVRWCVAPAEGGEPVAGGVAEVPAEGDHCVAIAVGGLDPATSYRYWFDAGRARSPVGRGGASAAPRRDRCGRGAVDSPDTVH